MSDDPTDLETELAGLAVANAAVEAAMAGCADTSTSLVHTDAAAVKARMAARHSDLVRARQVAAEHQERVQSVIRAKKAELDAMVRAMEIELGPVQEQVQLMQEGIWTINLYLGRDETITTIRTGDPAEASEPIAVRQLVLYMDEESTIAAAAGGLDATRIKDFDEWLISDPAHLEQVLPNRKGIVVLRPRRNAKTYEDPWQSMAMAEANKETYWLIRNGESLYRMHTDLQVGKNLVPKADEFTSFFTEKVYDYEAKEHRVRPIEPGSDAWLKAEKAASAQQRHFMRVALVLQGVLDRSTVLRPFPDGISFLEPESYDTGAVQVVIDDEQQLGAGRVPFAEWLAAANARLRVGMRVVGNYRCGRDDDRIHPASAPAPNQATIQVIESKTSGGGMRFLYERTDKRYGYEHGDYGEWGAWPFKQRASYTVFPGDRDIVCVDAVTVAELTDYLTARTERHAYEHMVPLLEVALAAKRTEAETEAPMRLLLISQIATRNHVSLTDAEETVDDLIDWYKVENRWNRALVTDDTEVEAKVISTIVAEHADRTRIAAARAGSAGADAAVIAGLRTAHLDAILIARRPDGYFLTFVPEREDGPFMREIQTSPTGRSSKETRWAIIGHRYHRWEILHTGDRWDTLSPDASPNDHLTDDEFVVLLTDVLADAALPHTDRSWGHTETANRRVVKMGLDTTRWSGSKRFGRILATSVPEGPLVASVPDRLLTGWGEAEKVSPDVFIYEWSKGRTGVTFRSWSTFDRNVRDETIDLWEDPALVAEIESANTGYVEAVARRTALSALAASRESSVVAQWDEWAHAAHYARFIEDFVDPDLWEAHLKAHPVPTFPWTTRSGAPLRHLIDVAIDHGLNIESLTVRAVKDLVVSSGDPAAAEAVPAGLDGFVFRA